MSKIEEKIPRHQIASSATGAIEAINDWPLAKSGEDNDEKNIERDTPLIVAVIDTARAITAKSQLLTRKLLASGGDIRALLKSNQPQSSLRALTADIGKVSAGQMTESKEDIEEEEYEERFVRPRRLRFAVSKEAASDGFPSAIACSLRWHPDHMQDLPEDAANLSIRAAFDTKFDEYYVFRHWRPSQGR